MKARYPGLLLSISFVGAPLLFACDKGPPRSLQRQSPGDISGSIGSADPMLRKGQRLPPGTRFQRASGKLETAKGVELEGKVKMEEVTDGVRVEVTIEDAKPNTQLAVHVHESGGCDRLPDGVGEHFNPRNVKHGLPGAHEQHLGDLGNIALDEKGDGSLEILTTGGNLRPGDPLSFLDRPVIVHEAEDRGVQPSGGAGKPIACALIRSE